MRKNACAHPLVLLPLLALFGLALGSAACKAADKADPQGSLSGQEKVTKKDFNGDGAVDSLTAVADGGSGFGGDFVTLKDGRTGRTFAYNNWGSYGEFLRIIPFDDEIMKPVNKGFKAALEAALFPDIPAGDIDSSLAWLIDAYSRAAPEPEEAGDPLFSQKIRFEPRWTEGEALAPHSYYLVTSDETLLRSFPIYEEDDPVPGPAPRQAWLVYYGHNHAGLEPVPAAGEVRVFKSAHGVAVSEGGRSCWAFVNDEVLADGPAKLRWPSIGKVALSEGLIFIHHTGPVEHVFVVDYHQGVAGRLAGEALQGTGLDLAIRDGRLVVKKGTAERTIDIAALKGRLR